MNNSICHNIERNTNQLDYFNIIIRTAERNAQHV